MSDRTYITLPRSQRVEDYLEQGQSLAIMAAFADAALAMRDAQEDWIDQLWIASATWGLDLWEALVGIVPAADATLDDRRKAVTAKLLGAGTCNAAMVSRIAKAITGYDAVVIEYCSKYQFALTFVGDTPGFADVDREAIRTAVEEVKPAHLEFIITGITWADFHLLGMRWMDLHAMEATWADIHNKVMIQPRGEV